MSKNTRLLAVLLALAMCFGLLAGCGPKEAENSEQPNSSQGPVNSGEPSGPEGPTYTITEFDPNATYTYNTASTALSSNWNPLAYEDNNSSEQFSYLVDGFYTFAFNDALHPMDDPSHSPYDGYVIIPAMAADYPVDVTEKVKAEHPEWIPADATSGYAWAVTLRDDLYFDTGYHITAETFVETAKRLLDPEVKNYRSVDFYEGAMGIVGAEAYALDYAGQMNADDNGITGYSLDDMDKGADGQYTKDGFPVYIGVGYPLDWTGGDTLYDYVEEYGEEYFGLDTWDDLVALMDEDGLVPCTDDNLALLAGVVTTNPAWNESEADLPNYLVIVKGVYPDELVFEDTVGYYVDPSDPYTLIQVLKSSVNGFYLYYGGLKDGPVVDLDVYDACMTKNADGTWSSTYMTSAETSPSYGPYSMVEYQTDKLIRYTKNDSWYGYHDDKFNVYMDPEDGNVYRLYQTTDIVIQVVTEAATRKQMFLAGELMGYGLQTEDLDEYRNSEFCYVTPGLATFFLQLTGNMEGIRAREAAGDFDQSTQDLETITLKSFRQALAVSFDRDDYCAAVSPANSAAFGLIGPNYVYDPDNAGFYRDTDQAKQILCDFYAVDTSKYASLDDAVESITGYDPEAAKVFFQQAFEEALELGYITDNDNDGKSDQSITITYTLSGEASAAATKRVEYLTEHVQQAAQGTPFEGKISFVNSAPLGGGKEFADAIKNGSYDTSFSGWTGAQMNPFNLLTAYTLPNYSYANNWYDTREDMLTLNINGKDITLSVYDWVQAVNGTAVVSGGVSYNFGSNDATQDVRLQIMAGVEGALLKSMNYIPFMLDGGLSLLSQQVYYVVEEFNPIMSRGGMAYMKYNYSDADWASYVADQIAQHGQLQY